MPAKISDLETVFGNFVSSILAFAGIVVFVLLLSTGFKYITSGGDPKALEGAKKTITYAVGGLILLLVSVMILALIGNLTGVDLVNFKITL